MRTIVDIPDNQLDTLNRLSKKKKISRAEIIREALSNYIANCGDKKNSFIKAFGIWKLKGIDSIKYQQELRQEWKNERGL